MPPPADKEAFDRRYTDEDAFMAWTTTPQRAEVRKHAEGCGTTFTTYVGEVVDL